MRYSLICLTLSVCFLWVSSDSAQACISGDGCKINPCRERKDFYGSRGFQALKVNFDYYDLIMVASPEWTFAEFKENGLKYYKNNKKTPIPYQAHQVIKNVLPSSSPNNTEFTLYQHPNSWDISVPFLNGRTGYVEQRNTCFDFAQLNKRGPFLIFAKSVEGYDRPLIIRATSIPESTYNEVLAAEMDLVFTGVLLSSEIVKGKGNTPSYKRSKYYVDEIKKGNLLKNETNKPVESGNIIIRESDQFLSTEAEALYGYEHKQQAIFYLRKDKKNEGFFELHHVTEDFQSEILKLQEFK